MAPHKTHQEGGHDNHYPIVHRLDEVDQSPHEEEEVLRSDHGGGPGQSLCLESHDGPREGGYRGVYEREGRRALDPKNLIRKSTSYVISFRVV